MESAEEIVWKTIDPDDIWVLDKLILSRKLNYICGPVGLDVPKSGHYIVRPCVNLLGLGLGAQKVWIEKSTDHLPLGYFWCEWFEGRHLSVDYCNRTQILAVEGYKEADTFIKWQRWVRVKDVIPLPPFLMSFAKKHQYINVEYIGEKVIEVHFRCNEDFTGGITEFIPVWEGDSIIPFEGYSYRTCPDVHGRIGAFVK